MEEEEILAFHPRIRVGSKYMNKYVIISSENI